MGFKQNLVSFFGGQNRRQEKREQEKEEEKKRKRKRRTGEEEKPSKKVWKLTLSMDSSMDLMVLYGILGNFMSFKPRVLIGFHPNPKILESKWVKPHMEQDKYGILPFGLDSWLI